MTRIILLAAIDYSIIVNALFTALGPVLLAVGLLFAAWIRSKLKTDAQREIFDKTARFMGDEVRATAQALRPAVVKAFADGRVSPEEAKELRDTVIAHVKANLGAKGLKELSAAIGDRSVDDYLVSLLESTVHDEKRGNTGDAIRRAMDMFQSIQSPAEPPVAAPPPSDRGNPGVIHTKALTVVAVIGAFAFVLLPAVAMIAHAVVR